MVKKNGRNTRFKKTVIKLLESGSIKDIQAAKNATTELLKYHWNYYSELAQQRSAIQNEIQQAIIQTCISYEISKWQRALKYKYALHPLSTVGSHLHSLHKFFLWTIFDILFCIIFSADNIE